MINHSHTNHSLSEIIIQLDNDEILINKELVNLCSAHASIANLLLLVMNQSSPIKCPYFGCRVKIKVAPYTM